MSKRRHRHHTREARRRDAEARRVGREHEIPCQTCGGPPEMHAYSFRVAGVGHSYRPTIAGIARLHAEQDFLDVVTTRAMESAKSTEERRAIRAQFHQKWVKDQSVTRPPFAVSEWLKDGVLMSGVMPLEPDA